MNDLVLGQITMGAYKNDSYRFLPLTAHASRLTIVFLNSSSTRDDSSKCFSILHAVTILYNTHLNHTDLDCHMVRSISLHNPYVMLVNNLFTLSYSILFRPINEHLI